MNNITEQKLNTLISLMLEGKASDAQIESLYSILSDSPGAVDHYIESISMISCLLKADARLLSSFNDNAVLQERPFDIDTWNELAEVERTAITVEVEKPVAEPVEVTRGITKIEKQLPSKLLIYTAILSTAAMLFLMLLLWIVPAEPPIVASLGYTVDAVWGQYTEEKVMGEELRRGGYYLEKGLVQIVFNDGAKVILEGPADFELSSTSAMELFSGKVVANVNRDAAGFTVQTPSGKVLDLGTEFGVDVDLAGNSDIHVFDGEVVLYPQNNKKKVPLLKGKAKRITTSGKQKNIELNKYAFVHQDEFNAKVKANQGDSYHRWLAYSYQLRRDPTLVAYYPFEYDPDRPDKLVNYAGATAGRLNGTLGEKGIQAVSPTWTKGRWPEKDALRFERAKKQLVIVPGDPDLSITGPITLAVWVRCPELDKGGQLLSCRTTQHINYQIRFADRLDGQSDGLSFFRYAKLGSGEIISKGIIPSGQWDHIAVTHDNKTVKYYLNGVLLDFKPHEFQNLPVAADLLIGAARNNVANMRDRMFNGIIDEIAILKRVLSEEEISEMYEAGKP
ncbi:MAG: FecR domain-containing protein [Anaerohalosphaera sp.]|nr:FecR domain-containing protein [Anaerohalosphaera sp.]